MLGILLFLLSKKFQAWNWLKHLGWILAVLLYPGKLKLLQS